MKDFEPLYVQKRLRKNLNGKQLRENLIKSLEYLKQLGLTPKEICENEVFASKAFQKKGSYELIQYAKSNNFIKAQELLMKNKYLVYDYDYVYMTPLHWSCKRGNIKLTKILLDAGSDIDALDLFGRPPLYYAIQNGDLELVKLLLYNKAIPWKNKYMNYDQIIQNKPLIKTVLSQAKNIHLILRMTPFKNRGEVWTKKNGAFAYIIY